MKSDIQQVMILLARAEEMKSDAYKQGQEYTDKNSSFKTGDKIIVRNKYTGIKTFVKVQMIKFDPHSQLSGLARLVCQVWTKDWKQRSRKQSNVQVDGDVFTVAHKH